MGIGISLFLLAVGAVLAFAVDYQVSGVDIEAVGAILMVVGAVGLLLSLLLWSSVLPFREREVERVYRDRDHHG